jgi:hypothetical protein
VIGDRPLCLRLAYLWVSGSWLRDALGDRASAAWSWPKQVKVDLGQFPAGYAFSGRSLDLDR